MIFLVIGGLGKVTELPGFCDPIKSLQFPPRRFGVETTRNPVALELETLMPQSLRRGGLATEFSVQTFLIILRFSIRQNTRN